MDRAAYYTALDGVTRYGLTQAVRAILQGALEHAFFPSPPELRMQCDKAMSWHERMNEKIRRTERENAEFNRQFATPVEKSPLALARVRESYRQFCERSEATKLADEEAARADVRQRYGLTPEVLASIPDQPLKNQRPGRNA